MLAFVSFVQKELKSVLIMYRYGNKNKTKKQKAVLSKCLFILEEGSRTHLSVKSAHDTSQTLYDMTEKRTQSLRKHMANSYTLLSCLCSRFSYGKVWNIKQQNCKPAGAIWLGCVLLYLCPPQHWRVQGARPKPPLASLIFSLCLAWTRPNTTSASDIRPPVRPPKRPSVPMLALLLRMVLMK